MVHGSVKRGDRGHSREVDRGAPGPPDGRRPSAVVVRAFGVCLPEVGGSASLNRRIPTLRDLQIDPGLLGSRQDRRCVLLRVRGHAHARAWTRLAEAGIAALDRALGVALIDGCESLRSAVKPGHECLLASDVWRSSTHRRVRAAAEGTLEPLGAEQVLPQIDVHVPQRFVPVERLDRLSA